jgi:hypothetical protein
VLCIQEFVILVTTYYVVCGRKTFTPPTETIKDYIKARSNEDIKQESTEDIGKDVGNGEKVESAEIEKKEL